MQLYSCLYFILFLGFLCQTLALDNGLGRTPPMGWTTWCTDNGLIPCENDFCNETEVMSVAKALVSTGLRDLGYNYVLLDDCWGGPRTTNGTMTADSSRFPSGSLKGLADFLHSLDLKLGVYTDVGTKTCKGGRPGSWGYYQQDADLFASWGVDFVKMDWCDHPANHTAQELYGMMSDALNKTGRKMFFNLCGWGLENVWEWGATVGNSWRVGPDHLPLWWTPADNQDPGQGHGTANIIEHMAGLSSYASPGAWNDPDFLMIGEITEGFNITSEVDWQTEFSFWCLFSAPLMVATDIRKMSDKQVLLNKDAIAVNQDSLGVAGDRIATTPNFGEIWSKPLSNGSWAVILYNSALLTELPAINITVSWAQIPDWPQGVTEAGVKDLWLGEQGNYTASFTASSLISHASRFLVITPLSS